MTTRRRPNTDTEKRADSPSAPFADAEKTAGSFFAQLKALRRDFAEFPAEALTALIAAKESLNRMMSLSSAFETASVALKDAADRQVLELESTIRSCCDEHHWRVE